MSAFASYIDKKCVQWWKTPKDTRDHGSLPPKVLRGTIHTDDHMVNALYYNTRRKRMPTNVDRQNNPYVYLDGFVKNVDTLSDEEKLLLLTDQTTVGILDDGSAVSGFLSWKAGENTCKFLKLKSKAMKEPETRFRAWLNTRKQNTYVHQNLLESEISNLLSWPFTSSSSISLKDPELHYNISDLEALISASNVTADKKGLTEHLVRLFYNQNAMKKHRANAKVAREAEINRVISRIVEMLGGTMSKQFELEQAVLFVGNGFISRFQKEVIRRLRSLRCNVYSYDEYDSSKNAPCVTITISFILFIIGCSTESLAMKVMEICGIET